MQLYIKYVQEYSVSLTIPKLELNLPTYSNIKVIKLTEDLKNYEQKSK